MKLVFFDMLMAITVVADHLDRVIGPCCSFSELCSYEQGYEQLTYQLQLANLVIMSAEERQKRHRHNFLHVTTHTAQEWVATFIRCNNFLTLGTGNK
ncbi:trehalose-6-phosphate synthase [Artemisia annua]|uniref:Trehalose-6-phosphate synthase n=1 Tax=Artemisia annua TaxID=35608 RepID=A0A2U1QJZ4_ARTAN|nr:trehalose-6-phosphate synthase [Artemisia annua]